MILEEHAHRILRNLDRPPVLRVEAPTEILEEPRDFLAPLAQRRDPDLDHVEPVVEVFAELVRAHRGFEVAVRRCDEPHIGPNDFLAADARELAVLQDVEQLGLQTQRHFTDLVEQQRSAVGRLELAGFLPIRAGERAFLVTEELGLEQLARQCRAIDLQKLLLRARRGPVESARHDLLADSALSTQEHGGVRGSDLRDEIANRLHLAAAAEVEAVSHPRPPVNL